MIYKLDVNKNWCDGYIKKYLLTSYVSTKAINPSGNAIANETIAANSPSLDSSGDTSSSLDKCWRWLTANSSKLRTKPALIDQHCIRLVSNGIGEWNFLLNTLPVDLCLRLTICNSSKPENDVI